MLSLLLWICFLPHGLQGHGCPSFIVSQDREFLNSGFLPESFNVFVAERNSSKFTGVYDCHEEQNGNEVSVSVICDSNTNECKCESLFQFRFCQSCSLCSNLSTINSGKEDDNVSRWLYSFSATCDGIEEKYPNCAVGCGFATNGCYPDGKNSAEKSSHLGYQNFVLFSTLLLLVTTVSNII
jgi:hypothetical protein